MRTWEQVFVAAAALQREQPSRAGFRARELLERVREIAGAQARDSTVNAHIYLHCLATKPPNPARYRILHRNADGTFRLFRPGDPYHPDRSTGRSAPDLEKLPAKYRPLVEWYSSDFARKSAGRPADDAIMALRGLGKEVWRSLGGVKFIEQLRADWFGPATPRLAPRRPRRRRTAKAGRPRDSNRRVVR